MLVFFQNVLTERIAEWKLCVCVRGDLSMGWLCSSLISTWKGAISYFCRPDMESQVSNRGLAAYGCGQPCLGWVLFSTSLGGEDGDAHAREGKCSWSRASLLQQHHGSCEHRQVHPSHHQQPEEITHVLGWWAAHRPVRQIYTSKSGHIIGKKSSTFLWSSLVLPRWLRE